MENNDVLRMFRYALNIPDATMVNIFTIAKCRIDKEQLLNLLKKKDEQGYVACSTTLLERFFDGLILYNRGSQFDSLEQDSEILDKKDRVGGESNINLREKSNFIKSSSESLSNNLILKKIRIALNLKQDEMIEIFRLGKVNIAKGEFSALFRKEGRKNYKECGDQYLKRFLQGLAVRHRM